MLFCKLIKLNILYGISIFRIWHANVQCDHQALKNETFDKLDFLTKDGAYNIVRECSEVLSNLEHSIKFEV